MDENQVILTQYYVAERQSLVEEATRLLRGDRMTAEDVVQTTFLRLLTRTNSPTTQTTNSPTPQTTNSPTTQTTNSLVHTTMLNLLRDLWRRRRYEQDYEHQLATAPSWARQADDVFSICSAHQITELLEHRLARMDSTVARVLRMNVVEGKPVSEISDELQMKYKTVENRLQTGRRQLRSYLKRAI